MSAPVRRHVNALGAARGADEAARGLPPILDASSRCAPLPAMLGAKQGAAMSVDEVRRIIEKAIFSANIDYPTSNNGTGGRSIVVGPKSVGFWQTQFS